MTTTKGQPMSRNTKGKANEQGYKREGNEQERPVVKP